MVMGRLPLPRNGSFKHFKKATVVAAISAIAAAGLGAAPAQSAPVSSCPLPYAVADLTVGQAVTGLTVSQGTTPDGFTGTVLGVVNDGIAPGLDMIMVRLTSTEIDRVGGIWEGMSGSPVYASDGRLIGAVAYGLSVGPSTVAGVTPAADMEELLTPANPPGLRARTRVPLPRAIKREIVASGAASAAEAEQGMSQLKIPFSVNGVRGRKRLTRLNKLFNQDNLRMVPAGSSSLAAAPASPSDIFPGSNIAASLSYGDVTAAGVGTTTAVCGPEVLAFGHPFNFTGPSTMTIHPADAVYVQEDPTVAPFKVANLLGPVGTITDDRLAGIHGPLGVLPETSRVTSTVNVGTHSRTGSTHISVPDIFPDIATTQLLSDTDRIFDGVGEGSGSVGWVIRGQREDGTHFRLVRNDVYADQADISFRSAFGLFDTLSAIESNGIEDVKINAVTTTSTLNHSFSNFEITDVQVRKNGHWSSVNPNRTLRLRTGRNEKLRVLLASKELGAKRVRIDVPVPKHAVGKFGFLDVFGGDTGAGGDEGDFVEESSSGSSGTSSSTPTFPQLLRQLRHAPHNDAVVADLSLLNDSGQVTNHRRREISTGHVVDGDVFLTVRGIN
jgi:SpoIVB peptidase S55